LEILTWYAMRWAGEVTLEEARRHLGVETQRQWSDLAIYRTTPLLFGLFSLMTLWASELAAKTGKLPVLGAAWGKRSRTRHSRIASPLSGGSSGQRRPCAQSCGGTIFRVGGREHEPPKPRPSATSGRAYVLRGLSDLPKIRRIGII
jgi:hypothetical protein